MLTRRRLQSLHGNSSAHKRRRESFEKALREAKQGCENESSSHDIVVKLLRSFNCEHALLEHDPESSTQKIAHKAHISGCQVGKAVLVSLQHHDTEESSILMCVLRSNDHVRLDKLAKLRGAESARLCLETEVEALVKAIALPLEPGAIPPLPQLFNVCGLIDNALAAQDTICIKTGSNHQLARMSMLAFRSMNTLDGASFAEERDLHLKHVTTMFKKYGALQGHEVPYCLIRHDVTATATEEAKAVHFPGACTLKAVVVKLDHEHTMCVTRCTRRVDLSMLTKLAGVKSAQLATAAELRIAAPPSENGPLAPFGHIYGMSTFVDTTTDGGDLSGLTDVAFSAGTATDSVTMRFGDYLRVLQRFQKPVLAAFTTEAPAVETHCTSSQFKRHLLSNGVHFDVVKHAKAYTAAQTAAEAKIPGRKLAKTVIVTDGAELAMAVVSACDRLDLRKLSKAAAALEAPPSGAGAHESATQREREASIGLEGPNASQGCVGAAFELASEAEFAGKFDNVEAGAEPPFGHMYGMRTFVDRLLSQNGTVFMSAGNHKELLAVAWADFERLVQPIVRDIAQPREKLHMIAQA